MTERDKETPERFREGDAREREAREHDRDARRKGEETLAMLARHMEYGMKCTVKGCGDLMMYRMDNDTPDRDVETVALVRAVVCREHRDWLLSKGFRLVPDEEAWE